MNTLIRIALISLLVVPSLVAQHVGKEPAVDPVLDATQQFKSKQSGKPNEVTVILDAPSEPAKTQEKNPPEKAPDAPVLVTGTPPQDQDLVEEESTTPAPEEPPAKAGEGLSVRVEKLKTGNGTIDPTKVKLLAPFPAKPLAPAPVGWRLESSENVPPFTREVELSPGKNITLSIRPHLLVPDADGVGVFHVMDPGFDSSLGYQQDSTIGAILSTSIRQLEVDSKDMGVAIDRLQQLLGSLPQPEPDVTAAPPVSKPTKSRPK